MNQPLPSAERPDSKVTPLPVSRQSWVVPAADGGWITIHHPPRRGPAYGPFSESLTADMKIDELEGRAASRRHLRRTFLLCAALVGFAYLPGLIVGWLS